MTFSQGCSLRTLPRANSIFATTKKVDNLSTRVHFADTGSKFTSSDYSTVSTALDNSRCHCPKVVPVHGLPSGEAHMRHAVPIHQRRVKYKPALFNVYDAKNLKEVWFPGNHGDIGGKGNKQLLSDTPLNWMIQEAFNVGDPERTLPFNKEKEQYARMASTSGNEHPVNILRIYIKKYARGRSGKFLIRILM